MDVLAVGMSTDEKLVLAFCPAHGQLIAHLVGFFRRDLARLEGLPYLVGDDVVFLAASGGLLVLPLG